MEFYKYIRNKNIKYKNIKRIFIWKRIYSNI
jgi:hypothetical protein